MIIDNDYEMLAGEVSFRWGTNLNKYDVQEYLESGTNWNLEPWEQQAIQREARNMGI